MDIFLYVMFIILFLITLVVIFRIIELKNIKYMQSEYFADKKILTVYYSNNGNTKSVAKNIQSIVGGDITEIKLIENYPNNIFKMSSLIRNQIKENFVPEIKDIDVSNYDIIFAGSPIWNFSISLPLLAFLKNNNFEGKTLIPFFTCSGGVSKNKIIKRIKDFTYFKEVKNPLFMLENGIILEKEQIIKWLNNI